MMARRWPVAAVLLLTLGGCGDEPEAEPATVPVPAISSDAPAPAVTGRTTATQAAAAGPTMGPAAAGPAAAAQAAAAGPAAAAQAIAAGPTGFVAVVQRELPGVAVDHRDEEIVTLAQQACAALAAGRSADAVVAGVRTFGTDRASARQLIRLAVGTVCPAQRRRIDEF